MIPFIDSVLFKDEFKKIPNEALKAVGLMPYEYSDTSEYSFNKLATKVFGFNTFQIIGLLGLVFLAR